MLGKLNKVGGTAASGGRLRSVGRIALWAVVALVLFRGSVSIARGGEEGSSPAAGGMDGREGGAGQAADAFAVRFVRAYLAGSESTTELMAPGASTVEPSPPSPAEQVAQAEAISSRPLGSGREAVTVLSELRNGNVAYVAVPIVRGAAGGVAATGAPAFVSAPGIGRVTESTERSQPIPGADAGAIRKLGARFIETYLSTTDPADLEYVTSPSAAIEPLGGFEVDGGAAVRQLGSGSPRRRRLIASITANRSGDPQRRFSLSYELTVEKGDRWYVTAVGGEVQ